MEGEERRRQNTGEERGARRGSRITSQTFFMCQVEHGFVATELWWDTLPCRHYAFRC